MAPLRNHQADLIDRVSLGSLGLPFLLSAPLHRGRLKSQYLPCHLLSQVRLGGLEDTSTKSSKRQSRSEDEKLSFFFFSLLIIITFLIYFFTLNYTTYYHNGTIYTVLSRLNNIKAFKGRKNVVFNPWLLDIFPNQ